MKSKDILKMLDKEIDSIAPSKISEKITATPIKKRHNEVAEPRRAVSHVNRRRMIGALCACLVCVAVLTGVLVPIFTANPGGGGTNPGGDNNPPVTLNEYIGSTYVTMDINPSIDFVLDGKDKVKNVISKNNDGDVLLSNGFRDTLIGKDIDDVVALVLDEATKLGYIDASINSTEGVVNSVRISVAGDSSDRASDVLSTVKKSATTHLKDNGIFMVVVDRVVTKESVLGASGIDTIEKWNETRATHGSYHYVNNAIGLDSDALLEHFKKDFVSEHVGDELEEMLDDIDDGLEKIGEIKELEDRLADINGSVLDEVYDFWYYNDRLDDESMPDDIREVVEEIAELISDYNEELLDTDDDDFADIGHFFKVIDLTKPTTGKVALAKMKTIYGIYNGTGIKEKLSVLVDDVKENIDKIDALLTKVEDLFGSVIDDINVWTGELRTKITAKIDKVKAEAKEYYTVCEAEIAKKYAHLVKKNENNVGTITPEQYDAMLEEILTKYDDLEDFWDSTHR